MLVIGLQIIVIKTICVVQRDTGGDEPRYVITQVSRLLHPFYVNFPEDFVSKFCNVLPYKLVEM